MPSSRSVLIRVAATIVHAGHRVRRIAEHGQDDLLKLTRLAVTTGRSSASSGRSITRCSEASLIDNAITSRVASFKSIDSVVSSCREERAHPRSPRMWVGVANRSPRRLARAGEVWRISGQHPQARAALVMMPDSGWLTSWAIDAVSSPS